MVEVAASSVNGHIVLSVADNGPGVPESERDIVFDKFYRGREAQRRGEAGSGLGLAIVDEIARLYEATMSIGAGANGRGTRVLVQFAESSIARR